MATVMETKKAIGTFCWADIASSDVAKTRDFYTKVLGWQAKDADMGDGKTYTIFKSGDADVGGMYLMDKEQLDAGMRSYWTSYVFVEDADKMAQKAKGLGAKAYTDVFDVGDTGRMAVLGDPTGASFALWQDKTGTPTDVSGPGSLCWFELATEDTKTAGKFYHDLFGWESKETPFPDMKYDMFMMGEASVGGMMTLPEQAKKNGAPPHWLIYVSVDDCDKTVTAAKANGGSVMMPPMEFEGVGRGAVIADSAGGVIGIIKLNPKSS